MNRRGFFAALIAPFLSRFIPEPKPIILKPRLLGMSRLVNMPDAAHEDVIWASDPLFVRMESQIRFFKEEPDATHRK